jgi:GMP synthase-like glutamine amidotransferase
VYYAWPFNEFGIRPLSVNADPVQIMLLVKRGRNSLLFQPDESLMVAINRHLETVELSEQKVTIKSSESESSTRHMYVTSRGLMGFMGHPSWYHRAVGMLQHDIAQHVLSSEFTNLIRGYREIIPTSVWIPGADHVEH